jgi:S-formylglutathione hydrolase FrmB
VGGAARVLVVLPAGYRESTARYPVIEVLHGRPGRPDDVLVALDLPAQLERAGLRAAIAVVPDGHGPVVADGDFADSSKQRMGAALSDDLRAWVDSTFRTDGHWAVTGYSAGGYGAAYLAARTQGQYDLACPISGYFVAQAPAFRGESPAVVATASPQLHVRADGTPMMVVTGDSDRDSRAESEAYAAALGAAGQAHELRLVPGGHDADVWSKGLRVCLDRFLGP